ncbi:MAG: heme o synthase [Candidatus Eisenbacteria bacterium]|nr:heme o synthase [Candidatus Eisenbacteria bacterium]
MSGPTLQESSAVTSGLTLSRGAGLARLADWVELTKPRITFMVLVTTLIGFFMATPGNLHWPLLVQVLVATALVASGASTLNQYTERDLDALMRRTADRPLPAGRIDPTAALAFGVVLSCIGTLWLALTANLLTGAVAAATVLSYVFAYTPLKRTTPLSTIVGAVPGALPPLGGWAAATGQVTPAAWVLFGIVFIWQLPHFLAIGRLYREDYGRAGYPMLPVLDTEGQTTGRHMVVWSLALIPVSLATTILGLTGLLYTIGALILGAWFALASFRFLARRTDRAARELFLASIVYLPVLCLLMALDKVRF